MPKINWKNEIGNPVYPSCKTVRDWCRLLSVRARVKPCFRIPETDKWLWFAKAETKTAKIRYSNPFLVEEYTGNQEEKGNEALLAKRNQERVEEEILKEEKGEAGFRIAFFRDNRKFGAIAPLKHGFGFLGVFRIDSEESRKAGKCVYKRVSDEVEHP